MYKPSDDCGWARRQNLGHLRNVFLLFLAHLSRRLIGELIVYPWSGVRRRPSASVVRRPSSSTMLKHLLLRNRLADQRQILCGASLGRGTIFCSRHLGHMTKMAATPIYGKNPSKIFFSGTSGPIFTKLGMKHQGPQPIINCSNDDPGVTLTYFTARSNLVT